MENNLDNLVMLLEECRNELHAPNLSEEDLQGIISKSNNYIKCCADELERAQQAIKLTSEQLAAVRKAREDSEAQAAAAAAEENDARIAAEMAQKMLDDAAMVYNIANTDTARILKRAAGELQEIIRTANAFYKQKTEQREKIDKATVNLFAREKSFEYAVAKALTNESVCLKEKIIAEKMAEVKVAEKEIIDWEQQLDRLAAEVAAARFDEMLAKFKGSLSEAEPTVAVNSLAEKEKKAVAAYLTEQKETCAEQVRKREEQKSVKLEQKQYQEEELAVAKKSALECADMSDMASGEVKKIMTEAEQAINESRIAKETAVKNIDDKLEEARQRVQRKETDYHQAQDILSATTTHFNDLKAQVELLRVRSEETKAEEESARDAAEVARRLADNAVKVRMSIRAESAELLLQAQEVLADSARVAEELKEKKHNYRIEIEKQYQETIAKMEEAEKAVAEAAAAVDEGKRIWDREEESLAQEIKIAEKSKGELDRTFEEKVKFYNDKLVAAQAEEAQRRQIAAAAEDKVTHIEQEIAALNSTISDLNAEIEQLAKIYEAIVDMERRESDLQAGLTQARAAAEAIIDAAKEQVLAVETQIKNRRAEEKLSYTATEEVADYLQSLNIAGINDERPDNAGSIEGIVPQAAAPKLREEAAGEDTGKVPSPKSADRDAPPETLPVTEVPEPNQFTRINSEEKRETAPNEASLSKKAETEPALSQTDEAEIITGAGECEPIGKTDKTKADTSQKAADMSAPGPTTTKQKIADPPAEEIISPSEETLSVSAEPEEPVRVKEVEDTGVIPDFESDLPYMDVPVKITGRTDTSAPNPVDEEGMGEIPEAGLAPSPAVVTKNKHQTVEPQQTTGGETERQISDITPPDDSSMLDWLPKNERTKHDRNKEAEAAEETAIMAGLTGNIPKVNKDEGVEYKAWLDIIGSDVIEKLMRDDEARQNRSDETTDFDNWMENLTRSFDQANTADKDPADEPSGLPPEETTESVPQQDANQSSPEPEKGAKKKPKKGFRFF